MKHDMHGGYGRCNGRRSVWVDDGEASNSYTQGTCPDCCPGETVAEEIARLQREIGERQLRLQRLVLGDPTQSVSGQIFPANGVG